MGWSGPMCMPPCMPPGPSGPMPAGWGTAHTRVGREGKQEQAAVTRPPSAHVAARTWHEVASKVATGVRVPWALGNAKRVIAWVCACGCRGWRGHPASLLRLRRRWRREQLVTGHAARGAAGNNAGLRDLKRPQPLPTHAGTEDHRGTHLGDDTCVEVLEHHVGVVAHTLTQRRADLAHNVGRAE